LNGRGIPKSVEIILASPSGTATGFQKRSGVKDDDASKLLKPEEVAAAIVHSIGKGHARIIVGSSGKAMALAGRFLPDSVQVRLWEQLMRTKR
jgi:short-subunit dehydrogenase